VCEKVIARVARILGPARESDSLRAIRRVFDEEIVASYLRDQFGLEVEVGEVFRELRKLAEETYENKSLSFGLLLDAGRADAPNRGERFPDDVLGRKRYRALSDGYRTGYLVSRRGAIIGFQDIELLRRDRRASANNFYPEWAEDIALASREKRIGMSLTRQGDLLVFDAGSLRFTYRYGRWQYWNHTHLIELLRTSMRVHRVPQATVLRVVRAVYRAAIDVSFRRSGGLFVILHSERHMRHVVRQGDGIKDERRDHLDRAFDKAMRSAKLQDLPRRVVVELAALDGAIVMNGAGTVLAYGAVLDPDKKGRIGAAEGSRTKAAIGASHYGVAVKVSSDGDITVFVDGKELIRV
jgi:hypothetical protein